MRFFNLKFSASLCGLLMLAFGTFVKVDAHAEEMPVGVVWQECPAGSVVEEVIRCRPVYTEPCYPSWQTFCDEPV